MKYLKFYKTKSFTPLFLALLIAVGISSCGEESFSTKSNTDGLVTNTVTTSTTSSCASFTLVKPKVDFLFLWDNSTSTVFINDETKTALANVVQNISNRFDYHIMLAPLVIDSDSSTNHQARLIASNTNGLTGEAISMMIPSSNASSVLSGFDAAGSSLESGVSRSFNLIDNNVSNGIFRPGSYLYIIVMSNQDDNSWANGESHPAGSQRTEYVNKQTEKLLCLRGNYLPSSGTCKGKSLNSTQLRLMNITSFTNDASSCSGVSNVTKGETYQAVSKILYQEPYKIWTESDGISNLSSASEITGTDYSRQSDQSERSDGLFDSYDLCSLSSFSSIFDGINNTIEQVIIQHKYNYWPVATSGAASIDPAEVEVFKDGKVISKLEEPVTDTGANGFSFTNSVQTVNTRYEPTAGESFTGYVVKLYGSARVSYPECMEVKTKTPKEYFGYINLTSKPVESSIVVKLNGADVPQSTTNGWELIKENGSPKFYDNLNIKIVSPSDYTEAAPAVNKSGYMLKLYGTAIYSNGMAIEVFYDPAAN
jgi:hypothetical protein